MFSALPFNGRQEERYLFIVSDRTANVLPPAQYRPVITQHSYCFISRHEFLTSSYTYRQLRTSFSLRMFALGGVLERLLPEDKKLSHSYYTASTENSHNQQSNHRDLGRSLPETFERHQARWQREIEFADLFYISVLLSVAVDIHTWLLFIWA